MTEHTGDPDDRLGEMMTDMRDDNPDALLDQLDSDTGVGESHRAHGQVLRRAAELFRAQGREADAQVAEWRSCLFDFTLLPRNKRRDNGYGRFAPMSETAGRAYPHVDAFPQECLERLAELLDRTANPIHRALYADFVWDRRKRYPGSRKRPIEAARIAIDAYLEAARLHQRSGGDDDFVDALDRSAELALSIQDPDRIDRSKAACLEIARELIRTQEHPAVRWSIDILKTLVTFGRHLVLTDRSQLLALAEDGALFYAALGNHHIERSFLALLSEGHRGLRQIGQATAALARRAATFVVEAEQADSALIKLHMLSKAVEAYQAIGDTEKVDQLKQQLSEAGRDSLAEMHEFSVEVAIPSDVVERWVNRLLSLELDEALAMLGATRRFIPQVEQMRTQAEGHRQAHPFLYLAPRRTLDSAGRIVQKALTGDEQIAASETDMHKIDLAFAGVELGLGFDKLETQKDLTSDSFIGYLRSRPIFASATLDVVAYGVERYFATDYVSALHVLVPQLEDTFRDILDKLNVPRTSFQQELTREKPLDDVLKTPELRSRLGEDLATFLERLLILPESENLRNRTAHGLLKLEHCTRETTQWILLCYLQLAHLAIVPAEPLAGKGDHSSVD